MVLLGASWVLGASGYRLVADVVRHKKPAIDLDTGRIIRGGAIGEERLANAMVMQHARSDRPAFVIDAVQGSESDLDDSTSKELLHFYPAMGLSKQHWAHQVLLARCYDHDGAVAVLEVVAEFLQCRAARDVNSSAVSPLWQGDDSLTKRSL